MVVDAAGKRSKSSEWLAARGVRTAVDGRPSGFVYACRHYKLFDRSSKPPDRDSAGNLDFLGYAAFYAEHDHFALTMGCPVDETELAAAMHRTEGFEALCSELPAFRRLTSGSEPTTKVLGAGASRIGGFGTEHPGVSGSTACASASATVVRRGDRSARRFDPGRRRGGWIRDSVPFRGVRWGG